jgi:hypothetical protein
VTVTLSDPLAGVLNTGTVGGATSTFAGGVWTASGPIADVNTLLAGLTFTPAADYDGNFTIGTSVSDGVAPALTGTKFVTGTPVNDAPVLVNNSFNVTNGGALGLTSANLSATDAEDPVDTLVFTVSAVTHGQFLVNGLPSNTFTQLDLTSGLVQFVHDGSGIAPTFMLQVADSAAAIDGPDLGNIVFNAGGGPGGGGSAGAGAGIGAGSAGAAILLDRSVELPIVPLEFAPDILPTPLLPLVDPAAQQFLRRPTLAPESREDGGSPPASTSTPAEAPAERTREPASSKATPEPRDPPAAPARAERLPATSAGPDADAERVGAKAGVIPAQGAPAANGELEHRTDSRAGAFRVTGIVGSMGGAAAIARATGLVANLLASSRWRPLELSRRPKRKGKSKRAAVTRARRRLVNRASPRRRNGRSSVK